MVAIKRAIQIEPYERKKAKERKQEYGKLFGRGKDNKKLGSGNFPEPNKGSALDHIAGFVGVDRKTLTKAKKQLTQLNKKYY